MSTNAELTGCACRWDAGDKRVATCVRHQGWLDVVSEWAERAKAAESALATAKGAEMKQLTDGVQELACKAAASTENARGVDSRDALAIVGAYQATLTAAQQAQPERAPLSEAELEQEFCKITGLETGINPAAADTKRALVWFKKGYAHGIKQGGQHD